MAKYTVRHRRGEYKILYSDFWAEYYLDMPGFKNIDEALSAAERLTRLERKK
jgi:hypothetical protein